MNEKTMNEKEEKVYIAPDGVVFTSRQECLEYIRESRG